MVIEDHFSVTQKSINLTHNYMTMYCRHMCVSEKNAIPNMLSRQIAYSSFKKFLTREKPGKSIYISFHKMLYLFIYTKFHADKSICRTSCF